MPTPSTGQISIGNIETEYGKLAGRPSGIGEYSRSSTGAPNAAEGIPITGEVKFSDFLMLWLRLSIRLDFSCLV